MFKSAPFYTLSYKGEKHLRIKGKYRPRYVGDSIILGQDYNQIRIDNCNEQIKKLIGDLANSISSTDLSSREDSKDLLNMIRQLDEVGVIENDDYDSDAEYLQRYKNNFYYFENFTDLSINAEDIQKKLNNLKVLVVGIGGASLLAASLVAMGVENITIVDFDKIELSNLNRQLLYSENSIGKNKIDETAKFLTGINRHCKVNKKNIMVNSPEDIEYLVEEHDIIIDGIDTPPIESNRWINYLCHKYKKPLFCMGAATQTVYVDKYNFRNGGCYDCMLLNMLQDDYEDTKRSLEEIYLGAFPVLNTSFMPNILIASGIVAMEIFKFAILGSQDDIHKEVDLISDTTKNHTVHKNSRCPICNNDKLLKITDLMDIAGRDND